MKIGILSGNREQYHQWISSYVDPYDISDYFYVSSVTDLFEKRGVNIQRVEGWQDRNDLYEIYEYLAHDGGLNDILLDGRYLNENTFRDDIMDGFTIPLESYVRDRCIHFKSLDNNKLVGILSWRNGYFEFNGDTKESAKAFFEDVRNVSEEIIEDKYIKRTLTFSEYDEVNRDNKERIDRFHELVEASILQFVDEYDVPDLGEPLSYLVDRLIYEAEDVFTRVNKGYNKED